MVQVAPYKVCCEKYSVKCCDGCHRSAGGYATAKSDVSAGRPLGKKKKTDGEAKKELRVPAL